MKIIQRGLIAVILLISVAAAGQSADQEKLEEMVTHLAADEMMGRGFGSAEGKLAASYIADQFWANGVKPFFGDFMDPFDYRVNSLNVKGNNVVGVIKGNDPDLADEYIILGAHYDHVGWELLDRDTIIYNGADDNASGTAAIIEIGRILVQNRDQLGRSVLLIAFDGEESGLIGSNAFVDEFISGEDPLIPPESVAAMFSLDMVGMYDSHNGVELGGIENIVDYMAYYREANDIAPIEVNKFGGGLENRTDTAPFGALGIPSVHVFTGMESPYHEPEDDSDLLEYEGMAAIVDFMAAYTQVLSTAEEVNRSKKMESISDRGSSLKYFNFGITLNTGGSHHDYKNDFFEAKGVFSYAAGISLQTRLSQMFAIQPEVLYEWSGSQADLGKLRTHAVSVPISLLLTTPDESGMGVRAYYQLGGYYTYYFGGSYNGTDLDYGTGYSDMDYGMVFGAGMEIMNFRIGYVFKSSLVDFMLNDTPDQDVRLKGSYFKIGWVF